MESFKAARRQKRKKYNEAWEAPSIDRAIAEAIAKNEETEEEEEAWWPPEQEDTKEFPRKVKARTAEYRRKFQEQESLFEQE